MAVPAKLVEQFLRGPSRRAGIAAGQQGPEAIAPVGVGLDAPAQIVFRLGWIEERIPAQRVGVPDIDHGAGDRLAVRGADLTVHEQHLTLLATVVQPSLTLRKWGARDVQRALDRARRAAFDPSLLFSLVQPQVEEGLQTEARYEQSDLAGLAETGQVAHGRP